MLGILLIDKPQGMTSHDVINRTRRVLGTKRVGHSGTLDPLATGLLVVAVGPATRFLQYLPLEPKVYVADIRFGLSSTTYDAEGEMTTHESVPPDLRAAVETRLPAFRGLVEQLPPMFSAIKVQGKPLYKYARMGQELQREPRTIHVDAFDVLDVEGEVVRARIVCSGGTYIRSLAHDLGMTVGCGAYLSGLRRTDVGRFSVDDAVPISEISARLLVPLRTALPPMPLLETDEQDTRHVREGRAIDVPGAPAGRHVALVEPRGEVYSVARVDGNLLQPECVIPSEVFDATL